MALQKTPIAINFTKGLDLKSDPFQVQVGNFLSLNNSVFTTIGRLTKRSGFSNITTLPNIMQTTLTTLNDNLIATGSNLYAYSQDTNQWLNQGTVQPVQLNTVPLVRVSTSQTSPDSATAVNGVTCLAYMDNSQAYYQVSDSTTGQQIVTRTALPASAVFPRVFILGVNFIVTFLDTVSAATHLQYVAIPLVNPNNPGSVTNLYSDVKDLSSGYDGYVVNNTLYLAYEATSTVKIGFVTSSLGASAATSVASSAADVMTVYADAVRNIIFIAFWDSSSTNAYSCAFNYSLTQIMAKTTLLTGVTLAEITSTASSGVQIVYYETVNAYGYDASIPTDFLSSVSCTLPASGTGTGTVGTPGIILRSVGLGSKAFINNGTTYMLAAYQSPNQSSYFLIDGLGNIYMRLAYSNGGGYAKTQVLPSISYQNSEYFLSYLDNDFLATVNKGTNLPAGTPPNAIYTQTGVNLVIFTMRINQQHSAEIAGTLNLTGGMLWEYDGVRPVENGFQVWPDSVEVAGVDTVGGLVAGVTYFWQFTYEWTNNAGNLERSAPSIPVSYTPLMAPSSFTGDMNSGSAVLTSVSSFTGLQVGQAITGVGVRPNTYILSFNVGAGTLTMSSTATASSAAQVITPTSISSVTIYVPTDRLTYKITPNPIRIVGYRWSSAQEVYYQFTSLTSPQLNDTTVDYETFTDSNSDAAILGNVILYTTGGVIENIAAPASIATALFDNRLWLIDAEDQNLLWFSKQVIEAVPVEMSDLLTYYVAPTTSAQGSTGTLKSIYPMDDKLILFKNDAAYYINGTGPDNTGSNGQYSQPIFITASVGCANQNSIVLTPMGLMFQSDKGIWLLGRDLQTSYIGAPVEAYNATTVMSATAVPGTTQVRFILQGGTTLMYDYFFQQWATHSNISAISGTLYQGFHTYLNTYGQILQEAPGTYVDISEPVLMSLTTSWINVAGLQGFERFYFANLLGTYFSPFTLQVGLAYNYNPSNSQAITVAPDNYTKPWGGEALWGSGAGWGSDQDTMSGSQANVFSARLWPNIQKCQSFQVSIQEVFDPSLGVSPGEGLTLSGLALIVGTKKGYRTQSAIKSFGS
jgi:hypothetical protein